MGDRQATNRSKPAPRLQSIDIIKKDWASVLNSTPAAIGLLGECMIASSTQNASSLLLHNPDLAPSLPANMTKCAQMGTTTFTEAHLRMNEIAMNTEDIGKTDGIIDKIMARIEGKDSPAARRMLARQLTMLDSAATLCTAKANEVNEYFDTWQEFSSTLLDAINAQKAGKDESQDEIQSEIDWRMRRLVTILKNTEETWRRLYEINTLAKAEAEPTIEPTTSTDTHSPKSVWELATSFLNLAKEKMSRVTSQGSNYITKHNTSQVLVYRELQHELLKKQKKESEDNKAAIHRLDSTLEKLKSTNSILAEVTNFLNEGIRKLQAFQAEICSLLHFFKTMGQSVKLLVKKITTEFIDNAGGLETNQGREAGLKDEIRKSIILMKARFLLVYGISQVYSEVSLSYILPGISKINSLGLSCDPASSEELALKKADLSAYTKLAGDGVKALTHQRQYDIDREIERLTQETPSSPK